MTANGNSLPIRTLLATSQPRQPLRNHADAIEATWTAYVAGMDLERQPWELALEGQLQMDALYREEERLRRVRGIAAPAEPDVELLGALGAKPVENWGSMDGSADGRAMHAYLVSAGVDLPLELTPAVIEEMRGRVGLNKGGPAKKRTARAVVDDFAKGLK